MSRTDAPFNTAMPQVWWRFFISSTVMIFLPIIGVASTTGCSFEPPGAFAPFPSNGANADHLDGVTQGLTIPAGLDSTIDTDNGEIIIDGAVFRADGPGLIGDIHFTILADNIAILAVDSLSVELDARVRVAGTNALILLSSNDVLIQGAVDISGGCIDDLQDRTCGGPGGFSGSDTGINPVIENDNGDPAGGCAPGGNGTGNDPDHETGGAGGGFGTRGANGGTGGDGRSGGLAVAPDGSCPDASLVPLMGGSGGGAGGLGVFGGVGGGGGGALQITSLSQIIINGAGASDTVGIRSSGKGGGGGTDSDGGGGGGSGGAILLEAPAIELRQAVLAANGGAGGSGGNTNNSVPGEDGHFGPDQAEGGGIGNRKGGRGGSLAGMATNGSGGADDTGWRWRGCRHDSPERDRVGAYYRYAIDSEQPRADTWRARPPISSSYRVFIFCKC